MSRFSWSIVLGEHSRRAGVDPTTALFLIGGGSTSTWQGTCIVYDDREGLDEGEVARRDGDAAAYEPQ